MPPRRCLLDENLPRRLAGHFSEAYGVVSVHDTPYRSYKNGKLLRAMIDDGYDCLITADQNLAYQQNLNALSLGLLVIVTRDIRLPALVTHFAAIEQALSRLQVGQLVHVNLITK